MELVSFHQRYKLIFVHLPSSLVGRDNSVGIAPRYGLDGPGIEFRWGRDFPHPSRPAPGAHPASCKKGTAANLNCLKHPLNKALKMDSRCFYVDN
jgi:hypothetical protein